MIEAWIEVEAIRERITKTIITISIILPSQ